MTNQPFAISPEQTLRINAADLLNEAIDGETIIVHMVEGNYYSLRGVGSELWAWLLEPITLAAFLQRAAERYAGDWSASLPTIEAFLKSLQAEGLLEIAEAAEATENTPKLPDAFSGDIPYEAPALEKYTDMQDLLLLDPIHEVDDRGWPHAKPQ